MTTDKIKVIFDTDLGEDIDDLYALYLTLLHPRLDLVAVTMAHGDTRKKAKLVRKVLRMVGRPDIPVGAGIGMSIPRQLKNQTNPNPWVSNAYQDYVTEEDPEWNYEAPSAQEVIRNVLEKEEKVSFVAVGAFSNVAEALSISKPEHRAKIECIAGMAGEISAVMSEYNINCDPEAADYVLSSGLPVFLGTFLITRQVKLTMAQVKEYYSDLNNPMHKALRECTDLWHTWLKGVLPGPVLYDIVPVFWLADHDCVKTRMSEIRVELNGDYTRGQTVRRGEGNVFESLELDPDKMMEMFLDIVK